MHPRQRGLMPPAQPAPGQYAMADPSAMPEDDLDGGEPAPPEEQDLYERFVAAGTMMLYDQKFFPTFAQMVKSMEPKAAVADAVAKVSLRTVQETRKQGVEIPGEVVLQGAKELTEGAADAAERVGAEPFSPQDLEEAYYMALDRGRAAFQAEGLIDEQEAQEGARMIEEMQSDGRLDQALALVEQARARANYPTRPTDGADLPGAA